MAADILTKSLPSEKHQHCMQKLGMCLIPQSKVTPTVQALVISRPIHLCGSITYLDHSLSGRLSLQWDAMSKKCPRNQNLHTKAYEDKKIKKTYKDTYQLCKQKHHMSPKSSKRDLAHRLERSDDDMRQYSCRSYTDKGHQMLEEESFLQAKTPNKKQKGSVS